MAARLFGGLEFGHAAHVTVALSRLFWITYRHDFTPLPGTSFTSDAGWGCMIRSGQMLAATAMVATLLGSNWLASPSSSDVSLRELILRHFVDTPSAPLSLHQVVSEGSEMGRRAGEWHAPSITANCLSNLINRNLTMGLRSYCVLDMIVDADTIEKLLEGSKVLVWLPMRLGVESLNDIYVEVVKELLTMPQSVGIAGGRPNSSLYFVGYDGSDPCNLIYLDPHFSRHACTTSQELSEEAIQTYSCTDVRTIPITLIDPCFVAGFVISDLEDLASWLAGLQKIKSEDQECFISVKSSEGRAGLGSLNTTIVDIGDDVVAIDM